MHIKFKNILPIVCFLISVSYVELIHAEPNQKQLQHDIKILDGRLGKAEKKAAAIRQKLISIEKKLGEQTRKSYVLERKITKIGKRLEKTKGEKKELDSQLEAQKKGLSQQIVALYSSGEQSHLRLLLKQDDPSDIGRTIKYFEYLNKSRINKIKLINKTIETLHKTKANIVRDKGELHQLRVGLSVEKKASQDTLKQRKAAYKKVKKLVKNKKQQLAVLKKKESNLQAKIDRLIKKRQIKKEAQQRQGQTKQRSLNKLRSTEPRIANKPKKNQKNSKQVGTKQQFISNRKFSKSRGKLSWPVKGKIIHSYGEKRNQQQRWKGVVIAASGGSRVKSVARGKVEFSGWFNGYGYLVIIRHDNDYRSLYGYNRAIYVKTGQTVEAGSTIAAVGSSGGQQQNALYFEVRRKSRPRDPAKWCK